MPQPFPVQERLPSHPEQNQYLPKWNKPKAIPSKSAGLRLTYQIQYWLPVAPKLTPGCWFQTAAVGVMAATATALAAKGLTNKKIDEEK